jgi:PhnB protein
METNSHRSPIVPYLCVTGAEAAIAFYSAVFGAQELDRYQDEPNGPIGHATLEIDGALLFVSDEYPEIGVVSPLTLGGTPVSIHITLPDVDAATKRATDLGAKLLREPADQPFGERIGKFTDPFGHNWMVATIIQ